MLSVFDEAGKSLVASIKGPLFCITANGDIVDVLLAVVGLGCESCEQ